MTDRLLVGLDVGTHVLKGALLDAETGAMVSRAAQRLPVELGDDGRRETHLEDVETALDAVMVGLRMEAADRWGAVDGIGIATQGGSTILCDAETGDALTPMALWNDARCMDIHAAVAAEHPASFWRGFSLRDEPGMGLARLRWLGQALPGCLAGGRIYGGVGEYLVKRLTGVWRQDACNAAQIGVYNAVEGRLDDRPLQGTGLDLGLFAPLRNGHELQSLVDGPAARWGLRPGLAVAGPYNDHEAGYASVSAHGSRPLLGSLGTAWVGTMRLPERAGGASAFGFILPAPVGPGRIALQPLLTGNVTWEWAMEQFVHADRATALRLQEAIFGEEILPTRGLVALPWLNRPNPMVEGALGGAALLGISPLTTRHSMLRAVAVGMCFEFARVLSGAARTGEADAVVLAGGAARGRHFRQLHAALFDPLPVLRVEGDDWMGTRGAVHGLGGSASAIPVRPVEPDGTLCRDAVAEHYAIYREAFDRIYGQVAAGAPLDLGAGEE